MDIKQLDAQIRQPTLNRHCCTKEEVNKYSAIGAAEAITKIGGIKCSAILRYDEFKPKGLIRT